MSRIPGIIYHKPLLRLIDMIRKPKSGKITVPAKSGQAVSCFYEPSQKEFSLTFKHIIPRGGRDLPFGKQLNNISFESKDTHLVLEDFFLGSRSSHSFTATVSRLHSKGYSKRKKYFYRLIIPLKSRIDFHYQIEQSVYSSDFYKWSRSCVSATIGDEELYGCVFADSGGHYYLSIESRVKQNWGTFSDKAHAFKNALGYLSGHLAGDQGFYFAYDSLEMEKPDQFFVTALRDSIKSMYLPIYSNPYGYIRNAKLAQKYYNGKVLRSLSNVEFSLFCQRLYESAELQGCVVLIMESSVASLLFMPGGFAIALETLSDLIIGSTKLKLAPIKDKHLSRKIRKECTEIIQKYGSSIDAEDLKTLLGRIEHLNQQTNKARLRSPFDLLKIELLDKDIEVLQSRNDFLHGRYPDFTHAGKMRSEDRMNRDLYYASMRFYTLLSLLLLKWIGYDNYVINHPKIQSSFTGIQLTEASYRKV